MSIWIDEEAGAFVLAHVTWVGPVSDRAPEEQWFKISIQGEIVREVYSDTKSAAAKREELLAAIRQWHEPATIAVGQSFPTTGE